MAILGIEVKLFGLMKFPCAFAFSLLVMIYLSLFLNLGSFLQPLTSEFSHGMQAMVWSMMIGSFGMIRADMMFSSFRKKAGFFRTNGKFIIGRVFTQLTKEPPSY